eukprot:1266478-Pyramimonas_sp.AAC.1
MINAENDADSNEYNRWAFASVDEVPPPKVPPENPPLPACACSARVLATLNRIIHQTLSPADDEDDGEPGTRRPRKSFNTEMGKVVLCIESCNAAARYFVPCRYYRKVQWFSEARFVDSVDESCLLGEIDLDAGRPFQPRKALGVITAAHSSAVNEGPA